MSWAEIVAWPGPSTSAAIEKLRSGVSPYETGKHGVTNGSAARVPPQ